MKKIRDFKCNVCLQVFEVWVEDDITGTKCKYCGGTASKCVSAPRVKGNTLGKSASFSNRRV
jgi:rRNA maturation endonuclease Nob1